MVLFWIIGSSRATATSRTMADRATSISGSISRTSSSILRQVVRSSESATCSSTTSRLLDCSATAIISVTSVGKCPLAFKGWASAATNKAEQFMSKNEDKIANSTPATRRSLRKSFEEEVVNSSLSQPFKLTSEQAKVAREWFFAPPTTANPHGGPETQWLAMLSGGTTNTPTLPPNTLTWTISNIEQYYKNAVNNWYHINSENPNLKTMLKTWKTFSNLSLEFF